MPRRRYAPRDEVSATELAEMGFCEKRVQLAHLYGAQATPEQLKARARGNAAHREYLAEGLAATVDRRCFVSTFVFGPDAHETLVLRTYRDVVLLRRLWGRILVAAYYRVAPVGCRVMAQSPAAAAAVRRLLRLVVTQCERSLRDRRSP